MFRECNQYYLRHFYQVVASDVLKFLEQNPSYRSMVLYGFSVGGYLWGEVMVQMAHDKERYQPVIDRIVGQVWDSAADVTEIHKGVPAAVFPRNKVMESALAKYIMCVLIQSSQYCSNKPNTCLGTT